MGKISKSEEAQVPDGAHCVDYSVNQNAKPCQFMSSHTSKTDWSDGLGSPGSITHYTCTFFRYGLSAITSCPLTVEKCPQCAAQS